MAVATTKAAAQRAWTQYASIGRRIAAITDAAMKDQEFDLWGAIYPATVASEAARLAALAAVAEMDRAEASAARGWQFILLGNPCLRAGQLKRRRNW